MERQDKIRIAVTSGIAAVILLILVLVLALSGKKEDGQKLEDNIASYSDDKDEALDNPDAPITASKDNSILGAEDGEDSNENSDELGDDDSITQMKHTVFGNSFFVINGPTLKTDYSKVKYDVQNQMYEMYEYWFQNNLEAVRDLAHLERFEAMSYSLTGTSDFYYYGEKDDAGNPNGMGMAVYAGNQYYYGNWFEGKRSGQGAWICFYPEYNPYVVTEHLYSGIWEDDLPEGDGQEHFDYNPQYMKDDEIYLQNAIGGFSKGKYNGEMYIITLESDGNTKEWDGKCDNGNWELIPYAAIDKQGNIPVLTRRADVEDHIYMSRTNSRNNGVRGIIYGGSMK